MPFTYQSGERVITGDRVLFHGEPAEIEIVVEKAVGDSTIDWYFEEHGAGIVVLERKVFGRVFLRETKENEDLVFVSRQNTQST